MGMPNTPIPALAALALAACLSFSGTGLAASSVGAGAESGSRKAQVDFAIRIPEVLRLKSIAQLRTLVVPDESSGARVVEVSAANVFEVVTTLRAYSLQFDIVDPDVTAVEVVGLGEAVEVAGGGALVRFAPASSAERRVLRNLTYRFHFARGARPGPRPMPIAMSVSAS